MKLKELRKQQNKSQAEISEYLQVARTTYQGYELEHNEPTIETLIKLADFYNVTLDYLVGRNFANDVGYLTSEEREYLEKFKQLTPINKIRIIGEIQGLLLGQ